MHASKSHPVRGAWIEMFRLFLLHRRISSHPVRGAWIEIVENQVAALYGLKSHPVRGAWIEILKVFFLALAALVAPREGCVD